MIVVHHLERSRSHRVVWMLEELGVPYELRRYERDPRTLMAPPSLRAVHPMGKSPVIADGGLVLAESGAILEYLVDRYGASRFAPPPGTPARVRYSYWMHFAEGTAMPWLVMMLVFSRVEKARMPFFARPVARALSARVRESVILPNVRAMLEHADEELHERGPWFAGEAFTAADVQMSFPLEAATAHRAPVPPAIAAFLGAIHARPAYRRAVERTGGFDALS